MSNRFYNYDKGSSRSTRDDSRSKPYERETREESRGEGSPPLRSRERPPKRKRHSPGRRRDLEHGGDSSRSHNRRGSDEEVPAPPPPPRISKICIDFPKPKVAPIKMSLSGPSKATAAPKPTIASVFNADDDDEEPEEMPAEARMRMRNIGRETPTSAGPNSFGKTKQGFCDAKKVFEKNLKQALDTVDRSALPKFPQTIYKMKGP